MRSRERNCNQLSFLALGDKPIPFLLMSRTFHGIKQIKKELELSKS